VAVALVDRANDTYHEPVIEHVVGLLLVPASSRRWFHDLPVEE
jgi:hypothetical protein